MEYLKKIDPYKSSRSDGILSRTLNKNKKRTKKEKHPDKKAMFKCIKRFLCDIILINMFVCN